MVDEMKSKIIIIISVNENHNDEIDVLLIDNFIDDLPDME
jgi:hypothetical protein